MAKKKPQERRIQISIGFPFKHYQFIAKNKNFNIQIFCRDKLEEYIREKKELGRIET